MRRADPRPRVVVVGGGFGGLAVVQGLRRAPVDLWLVDRSNHHLFQPLLYQVATATLSPADIAVPLRHRVGRWARVLWAEVRRVDLCGRTLELDDGTRLDYDVLVLAPGATAAVGPAAWRPWAPGLKTIDDALAIRGRFLALFERAERAAADDERAFWQTVAIVGAGPTGVELAGAMREVARETSPRLFRRIDPRALRVVLVEAGPRVLPALPPSLSAYAERTLRRLGVEVRTGVAVADVGPEGLRLTDGTEVRAALVVWAAGVAASPLGAQLGLPVDRAGRVRVGPDLRVPGHPEVFVVGDLAHCPGPDGAPLPGLAPVAKQQGRYVARAIRAALAGRSVGPFRYHDRGSLAVIGKGHAAGVIRGRAVRGRLAWWVWLLVHVLYLVGFRNRLAVLWAWAWSYLTGQRAARLITGAATVGEAEGAAAARAGVG